MRIKLLRALCFGGVRKEPGTEIELADVHLVRELIWTGKAEAIAEKAATPAGPMTTDDVPDLVKGKARKGNKDAGQ